MDLSSTWLHHDLDPGASMLVPVPSGGVLVLGEQVRHHFVVAPSGQGEGRTASAWLTHT